MPGPQTSWSRAVLMSTLLLQVGSSGYTKRSSSLYQAWPTGPSISRPYSDRRRHLRGRGQGSVGCCRLLARSRRCSLHGATRCRAGAGCTPHSAAAAAPGDPCLPRPRPALPGACLYGSYRSPLTLCAMRSPTANPVNDVSACGTPWGAAASARGTAAAGSSRRSRSSSRRAGTVRLYHAPPVMPHTPQPVNMRPPHLGQHRIGLDSAVIRHQHRLDRRQRAAAAARLLAAAAGLAEGRCCCAAILQRLPLPAGVGRGSPGFLLGGAPRFVSRKCSPGCCCSIGRRLAPRLLLLPAVGALRAPDSLVQAT